MGTGHGRWLLAAYMTASGGCGDGASGRGGVGQEVVARPGSALSFSQHTGPPREFDRIRGVELHYTTCPPGAEFNHQCRSADLALLHAGSVSPAAQYREQEQRMALDLPRMKELGFNTVYMGAWWVHYSPTALPEPHFDDAAFANLLARLELLARHDMRAMLPLNFFLGAPLVPSGVAYEDFLANPAAVAAFEAYVVEFLRRIETYADRVYILLFTENMEPVGYDPVRDGSTFSARFRQTLGSLPGRLPADLRRRFTIGFHDYRLVKLDEARGTPPIEATQFDFVSLALYPATAFPQYGQVRAGLYRTDPAAAQDMLFAYLDGMQREVERYFGSNMPYVVGEIGESDCFLNDETGWHAWMTTVIGQYMTARGRGFALWNWAPVRGTRPDGRPFECDDPEWRGDDPRRTGSGFALLQPSDALRPGGIALGRVLTGDGPPLLAPVRPNIDDIALVASDGELQIFRARLRDPQGPEDIVRAQVMFAPWMRAHDACLVYYDRATATVALLDDAGQRFGAPLSLGALGRRFNRQCVLEGARSQATASPDEIALDLALRFTGALTPPVPIFGEILDRRDFVEGYFRAGTWAGRPANTTPEVAMEEGDGAVGTSVRLVFGVSDADGGDDVIRSQIMVHEGMSNVNACLIYIDHLTGLVSLLDDVGVTFGPPARTGTPMRLENKQCAVTSADLVVDGGPSTRVTLQLVFTPGFSGAKQVHAEAMDRTFTYTGYRPIARIVVPAGLPLVERVDPEAGAGRAAIFRLLVTDPHGPADVLRVQLGINTGLNGLGACFVYYDRPTNRLQLMNDDFSAWSRPVAIGSVGDLANSQCTLRAAASRVAFESDHLVLDLALDFQPTFGGARELWAEVMDQAFGSPGYRKVGTFEVSF